MPGRHTTKRNKGLNSTFWLIPSVAEIIVEFALNIMPLLDEKILSKAVIEKPSSLIKVPLILFLVYFKYCF